MRTRPVIGITAFAGTRNQSPVQMQQEAYFSALVDAGATPMVIPLVADPSILLPLYQHLDGVCFPGGPDVSPSFYGQPVMSGCNVSSEPRLDECEMSLMKYAIAERIPMLCICRGHQLLNVALGGELFQDLLAQGATTVQHRRKPSDQEPMHQITIAGDSKLSSILGEESIAVNTMHHQGIRTLGRDLRVVATSDDGVVEAVEMTDRPFVIGVQYHPEEMIENQPLAARLFHALVEASADQVVDLAGSKAPVEALGRHPR